MIKNKKYKIGFDIRGLIIFIVIMIPNFIWFAVPAPNDILRGRVNYKNSRCNSIYMSGVNGYVVMHIH